MERFTISKSEKHTIFEIYRACRLCGAGGGYRMPIIQNIVNLDDSNIELRQKIQDCLQLEVRSDDRMPPLICEICVDKVSDFYEFMKMARQTNIRTRTRLGLPLQPALNREKELDGGDCILGVTEPLHEEEPAKKKSRAGPKCSKKIKNEEDTVRIEQVNTATSQPSRSQSAKTITKLKVLPEKKGAKEKNAIEKESKENEANRPGRKISNKELENLIQDNIKYDDNSLLVPRAQKRIREQDLPKPLVTPKKPKVTPKEPPKEPTPPRPAPRPKSKQGPKPVPEPLKIPKAKPTPSAETPPTPKLAEPPKIFSCSICNMQVKTVQALSNHMRHHVPNYTKPQCACDPCGAWFPSAEQTSAHHRRHRAAAFPYRCRRCGGHFGALADYERHIHDNQCVPWETVPDAKCDECWKTFPTETLKLAHRCAGVDARPGGKCSKCSKTYVTFRNLKKHERTCNQRRKRDLKADPDVLRRLKPMQVRISRCDDLLTSTQDCCDVSAVPSNHGLDRHYLYPYMTFKVKSEPLNRNSMVAIHGPTTAESERDSYIHWDSEDSDSDKVVESLATLSIKKLFSKSILGKVPRKRRKIKDEGLDSDFDISSDIAIIINGLSNDAGNDSKCKNELLMASLNDIIGVPNDSGNDAGKEKVVRSEDDLNVSSEKSEFKNISGSVTDAEEDKGLTKEREARNEMAARNESEMLENIEHSNVSDTMNEAAEGDGSSKDVTPENEIIARNKNDDLNIKESKNAFSENNEHSNPNDTMNNLDEHDTLSKDSAALGNEIVARNENDDANINTIESKTASSGDSSIDDTMKNAIDDGSLSKNKALGNELIAGDENYDVNIHESINELSEKSEPLNISATINDDDDCLSNIKDTGNGVIVRNENYVNINESRTSLSDTNEISNVKDTEGDNNLAKDVVTENETEHNENDQTNTRNSNKNESENVLNDNKDHSNLIHTEFADEGAVSVCNVSTNPNVIETEDVNNEHSSCINSISNYEETREEQVLNNLSTDDAKALRTDSDNINRLENIEGSVKSGVKENSIDLETQLAAIEGEHSTSFNGIHRHDNETDQDAKTNQETQNENLEIDSLKDKESPIKHSIENIIGDTDKNPERYINEVISSLENIIKKNPRNVDHEENYKETNSLDVNDIDDQNLMDAIDAQLGEDVDANENDKITLDDLLPKEERTTELDDISDDDFNFDD